MVSRDRPLQLIILIIGLMMVLALWVGISLFNNVANGKEAGQVAVEFWENLPAGIGQIGSDQAKSDKEEEEEAAATQVTRKEGVMVPETFRMIDYPVVGQDN